MKEYAVFGIVIALVASIFFGEIYSEVSKAITEIGAVLDRAPR